MDKKINVLVFPCGSEIGLEVHRSLEYSTHIELIGLSSVEDHGEFVYKNYISGIPFYDEPNFVSKLKAIIEAYKIDVIYPTMDSIISKISEVKNELGCRIVGSSYETNSICLSKSKTYDVLKGVVNIPHLYSERDRIKNFPVFMKPDVGYGSRGAKLIFNNTELTQHLESYPESLILENLPGKEYTVDCFTNKVGVLMFAAGRERRRVVNGISVNTRPVKDRRITFESLAEKINEHIIFRGAWFFQVKENVSGELTLLEVASRFGGSSALYRNLGVNFALLSVFDALDMSTKIFVNDFNISLDRALNNKYKIDIDYDLVYVDFDDCILLGDMINTKLITFLFQARNQKKKIVLITKHDKDINATLKLYKIYDVFDEIIHLNHEDHKFEYMDSKKSIFIDDSFVERFQVHKELKIPVFAPDTIESLLL